MTRFLTIVAASGALALASVAAPTAADARCHGCGVAAGVIGGIVTGAVIAGAVNGPYDNGPYAYEQGYAYGPGYGYAAPAPYYGGNDYGYRGYGGSTCDYKNSSYDRQLQGSC